MPINKVYLSSTFRDLELFRTAAARSLRRIGKQVIEMEDYVAADERPVDKCLRDVAACDVYVGIFAHRYAFVPEQNNPESKSITELEYRHAMSLKKPCFIFLLAEDAHWQRKFMDEVTGENGAGIRIAALRAELSKERLASYFQTPDDLGLLIVAALTNLEREMFGISASLSEPRTSKPERRQITSDLFVMYGDAERHLAERLTQGLSPNPGGLSALLAPRSLFASQDTDFLDLDFRVQTCDIGIAVLSSETLARMDQDPVRSSDVLDIVSSRTGSLLAFCTSSAAASQAKRWKFDEVLSISELSLANTSLLRNIKQTLLARKTLTTMSVPIVGVPLVVAAMTNDEAVNLCANPSVIASELGVKAQERFQEICAVLPGPFSKRYGARRDQCRPPGSQLTVVELGLEAIRRLARMNNPKLRGRVIKLQLYPFDPLVHERLELRDIYRHLADTGCVLVVDEMSLFQPSVRNALSKLSYGSIERHSDFNCFSVSITSSSDRAVTAWRVEGAASRCI
jgi:hypothetical protein